LLSVCGLNGAGTHSNRGSDVICVCAYSGAHQPTHSLPTHTLKRLSDLRRPRQGMHTKLNHNDGQQKRANRLTGIGSTRFSPRPLLRPPHGSQLQCKQPLSLSHLSADSLLASLSVSRKDSEVTSFIFHQPRRLARSCSESEISKNSVP